MTEPAATEPTTAPEAPNDSYFLDETPPKDWMLDDLVRLFTAPGSGIGLTIQSNGASISGLVIGIEEYIDLLAKTFQDSPAPAMTALTDAWAASALKYAAVENERDAAGLPLNAKRYIHMRDVRVFSGSVYLDLPLWRGALRDVTGWSLGNVERD
ncbi:hypothetical protein J7E45_01305 [Microbacterium sp. ISL-59]|uniref:hypothetical protein n=1 Tax=Microbacterium sp. ISL-59 TaxID=2819159 RepID=UPI001BEA3589|nr:hypothetical protein [Microbacterium sp. ISL-59]MBT2494232.1 hypothetical protein [Microbacterium sp. ISL-59]